MTIYKLEEDLPLMGFRVKNFPEGIKEAFGDLVQRFGKNRDYYGLSWMDGQQEVVYYAMVKEAFPGEGQPLQFAQLLLEKGDYETERLTDWMQQLHCIKDIFQELIKNSRTGSDRPCVEWYQSDESMLCMLRTL